MAGPGTRGRPGSRKAARNESRKPSPCSKDEPGRAWAAWEGEAAEKGPGRLTWGPTPLTRDQIRKTPAQASVSSPETWKKVSCLNRMRRCTEITGTVARYQLLTGHPTARAGVHRSGPEDKRQVASPFLPPPPSFGSRSLQLRLPSLLPAPDPAQEALKQCRFQAHPSPTESEHQETRPGNPHFGQDSHDVSMYSA